MIVATLVTSLSSPAVALHATTRSEVLADPIVLHTVIKPVKSIAPVIEAPTQPIAQTTALKEQQVIETAGNSTDSSKLFIYDHESGNNPTAQNPSSGALGLGQALPASKLLAVCPNLDYSCQDAFFTSYMSARYGTWENAKQFWLVNRYW